MKTILLFLLLSLGMYSQDDTLRLSEKVKIAYNKQTPNQYGLRGCVFVFCSDSDAIADFYQYNLTLIFVDNTIVYLATSEIKNNTVRFILREEQYIKLQSKEVFVILFNLNQFNISDKKFFIRRLLK